MEDNTSRAVTLMEVLISIGIHIGLTAVITIIPAAGSQSQKALTESTKVMSGLPHWTTQSHEAFSSRQPLHRLSLTLLAMGCALPSTVLPLETLDGLSSGIAADEVFRSQDDVGYTLDNSGQEDPPEPLFYTGNTKRIAKAFTRGWQRSCHSKENYLLSVVSFHRPRSDATDIAEECYQCFWKCNYMFMDWNK